MSEKINGTDGTGQMVRLAAMKFEYPVDLMKPAIAYGTWMQ